MHRRGCGGRLSNAAQSGQPGALRAAGMARTVGCGHAMWPSIHARACPADGRASRACAATSAHAPMAKSLEIEYVSIRDNKALMHARLIIDKAGRVIIPKALRDELQLEAGDALELEVSGERITLSPCRRSGPLGKKQGVWVLHAGQPILASTTDALLQRIREGRDIRRLGSRPRDGERLKPLSVHSWDLRNFSSQCGFYT